MTQTIFCDIDGVILTHEENFTINVSTVLPGAKEKLLKWHTLGYYIVLVTGRTEAMRTITEKVLIQNDIFYDQLVMGVGSGPRTLINDIDPKHPKTLKATAINLQRNVGLDGVFI